MPWRVPSFRPRGYKKHDELRPNSNARGYGDKAWKQVRKAVIQRDGSRCRMCGLITANPHVDHIVPKPQHEPAAATPMEGLQVLCAECHSRKTALESR